MACPNVFHHLLLRIEPIRILKRRYHNSIHNTECDGFKENASAAKSKNGGKDSLRIGKKFISSRMNLQLQRDFLNLFLAKVLQIYVLSFWEMEKLLLREKSGKLLSFWWNQSEQQRVSEKEISLLRKYWFQQNSVFWSSKKP